MWKATLPKYIEYTPILVSTKYNQLIDKGWTTEQLKLQQNNEQVRTRAIQIVVEWSVTVIVCKTALRHWRSDDDPPVALWGLGANLTRGPPPVRTRHKTHVNIHPQQLHFIHGCTKIGLKIFWTYNFQGCCRGYLSENLFQEVSYANKRCPRYEQLSRVHVQTEVLVSKQCHNNTVLSAHFHWISELPCAVPIKVYDNMRMQKQNCKSSILSM